MKRSASGVLQLVLFIFVVGMLLTGYVLFTAGETRAIEGTMLIATTCITGCLIIWLASIVRAIRSKR